MAEDIEVEVISYEQRNKERRNSNTFKENIIDERWKQKRRKTFAIFCLHMFSVGLEFTIVQSTMWSYIKDGMHSSHPEFFYGVICAAKFVSPLLLSLLISRWFDVYRRLRMFSIVTAVLMMVGYVLYIIPFSPVFPVFGNALQGFSLVSNVIIYSEILRIYKNDEIPGKFLTLLIFYGFGETIGPVIVKLLDRVEFWIGNLHIMFCTMPCLALIIFSIIKIILIYLFVDDLSRQYDLKLNESQVEETESSVITMEIRMSWLHKLKSTFGVDAILLLVQQFYTGLFTSLYPRTIPLIMQTLRYNNLDVDLCFIGASVSMMIQSYIVKKKRPSSFGVYYCGILSLLSLMLANIALIIIRKDFNDVVNWILLTVYLACYSFCWISDNTFIVFTLGKLFDSSNQSLVEGIRMMVHLSGSISASFTSAYIYDYFTYLFPVFVVANVLLLVGMVIRRKTLINPQAIIK